MVVETVGLQVLGDERGGLVVAEAQKTVPFEIKRVYWIHGTLDGVERGFHAHKELRQLAVAVSGACEMVLDDGEQSEVVLLNSPAEGVLIRPGVWHYMRNFTEDCVLLVFADAHYNESDYIRDYHDFISAMESELP